MSMTGESPSRDEDRSGLAADLPAQHRSGQAPREPGRWTGATSVRPWIWVLEHAQDLVTISLGIVLIVFAAAVLISAVVDFANGSLGPVNRAAPELLDHVLLVLILLEIVHTVVLSLRSHRLVAQPFIVVGLIAVIRRILLVLTPGTGVSASASELGLLIGMVAVFVAGLIAVSVFEKGDEKKGDQESGT
jgi:uncharacterized membrane protein (DUF373 family)